MSGINAGSGGGIHPGAPTIWPTSKQKKVEQTSQTQEVVQTSKNTKAQTAAATSSATAAAQTSQATAAPAAPPARPMAMSDIVQQLFDLNIPTTSENKQLASMMMQHGLELSPDNFNQLFQLLKGRTSKNALESAVITLSKGLANSPKSVDMLSGFLTNNPALTSQLKDIQQAITQFQNSLLSGKNFMESNFMTGLNSIFGTFDKELEKLLKDEKDSASLLKLRGGLLKDMKALLQFLTGIEKQLEAQGKLNSPEGKVLQQQLEMLRGKMGKAIEELATQAILSKDSDRQASNSNEKYFYWAIPNLLHKNSDIELLVRKDPSKKDGAIDPSKTRLIIKVDTPDLGEIVIIIDVLDNKVWYVFNTENNEVKNFINKMNKDLKERMETLGINLAGFQTVHKKIDVKSFILPTLNLDSVVRISAEA